MADNSKALAPVDQNVFLAFDRLDDAQIIAEMKGAALTEYVYEFDSGGKKVRGLSKSGTDDASRFMAVNYGEVLREIDAWLEKEDADAAYFKALAKRYVIGKDGREIEMDSAVGHKRQAKKTESGRPNVFWYEQGGQKALRNAKQKLIPETIKQAVIQNYIEQGKVRRVTVQDVNPAKTAQQPPKAAPSEPSHPIDGFDSYADARSVDVPDVIHNDPARKAELLAQIALDREAAMISQDQLDKLARDEEGIDHYYEAGTEWLEKLAKRVAKRRVEREKKQEVQA